MPIVIVGVTYEEYIKNILFLGCTEINERNLSIFQPLLIYNKVKLMHEFHEIYDNYFESQRKKVLHEKKLVN